MTLPLFLLTLSLSMCKGNDIFGKVYKAEVKNAYNFTGQIESIMYKDSIDPDYDYAATLYSLKSDYRKVP